MKEIIYLNTEIMNSLLAQLDEGIIKTFSSEHSEQIKENESLTSKKGKNGSLTGSLKLDTGLLPGGSLDAKASLGNDGNESQSHSKGFLEGQKDILNKAFHDHALNILIEKLNEKKLLIEDGNLSEGHLHTGESTYRFYDFDLIRKSVDVNAFEQLMLHDVSGLDMDFKEAKRIVSKQKPNAKERQNRELANFIVKSHENIKPIIHTIKGLNTFSSVASNLLDNLTVIKADDKIGLLKKEYLRESVESLSFRTENSRKIKYLVRVIGIKENVYSEHNMPDFEDSDLDIIPNMMLDILLGSFQIINKGDLLVTPIAIYYE